MKATLEFDLPEDQDQYEMVNNASNYFDALFAFNEYLYHVNNEEKNEDVITHNECKYIKLESLIETWNDILNDKNCSI